MGRIVVICEGRTEELAVWHFIRRQWKSEGFGSIGLDTHNLRGNLDKLGKAGNDHLKDEEVLAVFTLVDLQGMTRVVHQPSDRLETQIERVREWIRAQAAGARKDRFFPHVCVHQTEAWILAEGHALAARLKQTRATPDRDAESKNFQEPPSERLNKLFLRVKPKPRRYDKIADGTPLFKAMQFQPVYDSCPYFRKFYNDLKAVAQR